MNLYYYTLTTAFLMGVMGLLICSKPKIALGNIVLLHDNLQVTVDSLDHFIAQASANGIKFANGETIKTIQHA